MSKKVAVLALDPVNGAGLFQYLEAFFENGIEHKVFAVAGSINIHTNSGIAITVDDVIANLKGREDEYDAVVFSCGDAFPKFMDNINQPYNVDLIEVLKAFGEKGKFMIGHCAGALVFEIAGITDGKRLAIHPYAKEALEKGIATDDPFTEDGNFITVQTENTLHEALGRIVEILR